MRALRTISAIAVAGSAIAALAACTPSGDAQAQKVTLFSWESQEAMQPVIDAFEKETSINVEFSFAPPVDDYVNTLQTRLSSGTAADVFVMASENKGQIISAGAAADISGLENVAKTTEQARKLYGADGAVYAAAPGAWAGGIYYNKDLLAKVGYEQVPTDWDGFVDLCGKLKAAGITPIVERGDESPMLLAALLGEVNASLDGAMDADIWAGKTTFAKTWTGPLTKLESLVSAGYLSPNIVGLNFDAAVAQFASGEAAMFPSGTWALASIQKASPSLDIGLDAVPTDQGGYWGGTISIGYSVNAKAKNPDAAKKLVDFLMSDEALKLYQKSTSQIVTVQGFTNELPAIFDNAIPAASAGSIYWPQTWWVDNNQALSTHVVAVVQEMIQGKRSPEDAAASIDDKLASLR
ncbi:MULTISPECIES: ABC transporter substrate-binding protein [unclassified Microbacterium]|uniref:ABC transporter substrate-binding protein n=1 Tax=unclassified Microbacterium TaxID=2609290 RepID=UPI003015A275